tara:strand:- start:419 stop:712 length:294 start_codon:yes stop_codon:yes gene_type:complete
MVRPGLKRLQEAQRVKVQPNKTGTSFNLFQPRITRSTNNKKGVILNSAGNSSYNDLANSKIFTNEYTDAQKLADQNCRCAKVKEFAKNTNGEIIEYK